MSHSNIAHRPRRLAALALALVGAFCLAWYAGGGSSAQDRAGGAAALPADLALVPPDALGFAHVNVAQLWQNEVAKNLRQALAKEIGPAQQQAEKLLGLRIEDIDRATAFMLSTKDEGPMIAL